MEDKWPEDGGFFVAADYLTPRSTAISKVERLIANVGDLDSPDGLENQILAAITRPEREVGGAPPETMPSDILAMMKLAEIFELLEGDVHEILVAPIDIGLTKITVDSEDEGVEKEFIDLFDRLDMQEMVDHNWYGCQLYGQMYPVEMYDGKVPVSIAHLNPKSVLIGSMLGFGTRSMSLEVDEALREALVEQGEPAIYYDSWGKEWNEFAVDGRNILLNPEAVTHLHVRKLPFNRYAIPPIARAYRKLSTRQLLEEMVRATMEGLKNQFWLFTKEHFRPGEATALKAELAGARGDRTGYFVWPGLEVKVFIPGSIDQLLANEKLFALTQDVFRSLGMSMRPISGESPTLARGDAEIDVRILMERVERDRARQLRWLEGFAKRYIAKQNSKALKKSPPIIKFALNTFKVEDLIKNRLAPLLTFGLLSIKTALQDAGYEYDLERGQKEEEYADSHLWAPKESFAQVAQPARGPATTTKSTSTPGRTPDAQNPRQLMKASIEDYRLVVSESYKSVMDGEDDDEAKTAVAAFIAALLLANAMHIRDAYRRGYAEAGGIADVDVPRMTAAVLWNDEYAQKFEQDLLQAISEGKDLAAFERRANLYVPGGWRRGYMAGVFQAKREQGVTGWRRVLHPEASVSGPCELCVEDSKVIHAISEEFFDHPEGVCTAVFVVFYRGGASQFPFRLPPLPYPVPIVEG